jgi:small subunit ribosomal protein S23
VLTRAPPATFPQPQGKIQTITLPEDVYVKRFYKKYPESKYHDPIKYDPFFSLRFVVFPYTIFETSYPNFCIVVRCAVFYEFGFYMVI